MKENDLKRMYQAYGALVVLQECLYEQMYNTKVQTVAEYKKHFEHAYDLCGIATKVMCDYLKKTDVVYDCDPNWYEKEDKEDGAETNSYKQTISN